MWSLQLIATIWESKTESYNASKTSVAASGCAEEISPTSRARFTLGAVQYFGGSQTWCVSPRFMFLNVNGYWNPWYRLVEPLQYFTINYVWYNLSGHMTSQNSQHWACTISGPVFLWLLPTGRSTAIKYFITIALTHFLSWKQAPNQKLVICDR